ncbi:MAG TPA: hypothetical protein VL221_12870 [Bacteroidota bacterium]|nr:hypothetical protein [Bacteroidota bacterium]
MLSIDAITSIEDEYYSPSHAPALGRAYDALVERWMEGAHDRETALRLLFFIWYGFAEPSPFTGLRDVNRIRVVDLFQRLGGEFSTDPEVLFVVSVMCRLASWALGDEKYWKDVGERFAARLKERHAEGLSRQTFTRRGAYGHYFAVQWQSYLDNPD